MRVCRYRQYLLAVPVLVVAGCTDFSPEGADRTTGLDLRLESVEVVAPGDVVYLRVQGELEGTDMPHRGGLSLGGDGCAYLEHEGESARLLALENVSTGDVTIDTEGMHVADQFFGWGQAIEYQRVWHRDLSDYDVAAETPCTEADEIIVIGRPGELDLTS